MLKRLLARIYDLRYFVPLTPLGMLVLAASLATHLWLAEEEVDFVLYAASMVAIGVVAIAAGIVIVVSLLLLWRVRRSEAVRAWDHGGPLELESGARRVTGFAFPRFRLWPMVTVTPTWAEPRDVDVRLEKLTRAEGGLQEVVEARSRGRHPRLRRRFIVADIFGLARLGVPRTSDRPVRIVPTPAQISGHVIQHFVGGDALSHPSGPVDGELLDMRRYVHGDPLRRVLWKAFARSRQLLVRTPERAIAPSPSAVAYLVAGPGDEPTASTARFFVEHGLLGKEFLFQADGAAEATEREDEALEQIIDSAAFRDRGAEGLARFVERVEQSRRASAVLFVPPVRGKWLERVEAAARLLPGATVVLAVDHDSSGQRRSLLSRLLFAPPRVASEQAMRALPELVKRLAGCGFSVRVVHRPTGQLLPAATLEALAR